MEDIKNWILYWFINNSDVTDEEINKKLNENYFSKGWIDSLKFIELISDIENEHNLTFSNDEFQDRNFSTVSGLIKIIEDKLNGKI